MRSQSKRKKELTIHSNWKRFFYILILQEDMENATIQYGMTKEIIANHKLNVLITKWLFMHWNIEVLFLITYQRNSVCLKERLNNKTDNPQVISF